MFKTIRTSALHLSFGAALLLLTGAASAHPEMDEQGRDITSGTALANVGPLETTATGSANYEQGDGDITGSFSSVVPCDRATEWACGPENK